MHNSMKQGQRAANRKINEATKLIIRAKDELQVALNYARLSERRYEETGDVSERRTALRYYGKAWQHISKIIANQETVRWESRSAASIVQAVHDNSNPAPTHEEKVHLEADIRHYEGISKQITEEQEAYKIQKSEIMAHVRALRKASVNTENDLADSEAAAV